ncbi:hypothetical protein J6590_071465, partial [Homalodisca vitripennis]
AANIATLPAVIAAECHLYSAQAANIVTLRAVIAAECHLYSVYELLRCNPLLWGEDKSSE